MSPVRLIGPNGEQMGILPVNEALERAAELGLDLVEVAPNGKPVVCRILDYGKLKYELAKKDRAAKKKQHAFQLKEMRYRPKIDGHDFDFKTKHVREFIESGSKVRVYVMFRGREMAYKDRGRKVLDRVSEALKDIAVIDAHPKMEGRHMSMFLAPAPEVLQRLKGTGGQSSKKEDKEDKEVASVATDSE